MNPRMTKNALIVLSLLAASAGIEGCAVQADTQGVREEPVYVTGSNIARKDRVHSGEVSIMTPEAYDRARHAINPPIPCSQPGACH